ncbi:MAG TPA: tetratricopeptide repeat protein [Terriglobia bacterium]|nr:tetratricopeptide repeat protein [Terriglobia bacterium]
MAFDKAKALQEAHKYVAQGKTAKAIKHYEWVIEKDPGDIILLNVIGDLYAQENNVPEALRYFYKLADAYTREGYKVKAIAIYKKIAKIDRDKVEPLLRLAELNSAQGLAREAREHYKNALDFFERRSQKEQALEILRQLCRLEPKNHGLRLNLAQRVEDSGQSREAADAYLSTAVLARENGDIAACKSALDKATELDPENSEINLFRARQALVDQRPDEVGDILDSVPALQNSPEAKRLLLESYLATNKLEAAGRLLLNVLQLSPSNFAPAADFTARCIEKGAYDLAFQVLKGAAPVLIARRETGPFMETLFRLCKACPERTDILEFVYEVAEKTADEATIPEVLEALGDAYVQSDQFERAEQTYTRLVAREPENETFKGLLRRVLEKQGKEYVPLSQTPLMSADVGLEPGPVSMQFEEAGGLSSDAEQVAEDASELAQAAAGAGPIPSPNETGVSLPAEVFELSPQPVEFNISQPGNGQGVREEESELPPPRELSLDFQPPHRDKSALGISQAGSSAESASQQSSAEQAHVSEAAPPFNYEESREEIEFYLRHGFHQEARKAVKELERRYPGEGRVSEFRQRVHEVAPQPSNAEEALADPPTGKREMEKAEWDLPTSFLESARVAGRAQGTQAPFEAGADGGRIDLIEDLAGQLDSTVGGPYDPAMSPASSHPQAGNVGGPGSAADASAELGSLLDELNDANDSVDQAADDEQTHYNLGVAFREMGLLDEAIGEFQKVVNGTGSKHFGPHFLQGCTLLASCFMDKEMPAIAAKWYLRALDAPGLDHEGAVAIYYDLGVAFEKAGDTTAALEKFTEVYSQNIDYRDVAEKIRLLRKTSR